MAKKLINLICILLITSFIAPAALAQSPAPPEQEDQELAPHAPGEVLVKFQPWINSAQAAQHLATLNLKVKRQIPALGVKLVKLPPGQTVEEALVRISSRHGIEYVQPNYILEVLADPPIEIDDQWALTRIKAPDTWDLIPNKVPVVLAAVDTGVDRFHIDLADNIWINEGEIEANGVDDDGNGFIDDTWGWDFANGDNDPMDDNLHGTAVSSVMAGVENQTGVVGVCPWCKVMAVKVMTDQGIGFLDVVANGITYAADRGADVINLSLAGTAGDPVLEQAINYAWSLGSLVVAGAGNDGANAFMYPAGYDNVMAVAATDEQDSHACFSNYAQDYISVAAPGENMVVALPDNAYGAGSGTSLSSPMVAGLGGLLLSQDSSRKNSDLRAIIENTALDLSPPGFDAAFGHGRIDAVRAITGESNPTNPPDGMFSTNGTASGYAHARKLVRDDYGNLHVIWHTQEGPLYRIRHASSTDNGTSWDLQPDVYSSEEETYHSALAADTDNLYVAIPRRSAGGGLYEIYFTWKPISSGSWSQAQALMGGTYDAVRPDLYLDPTNGQLHLLASSLDNAPLLYYSNSGDQGLTWSAVVDVNPSFGTQSAGANTRYATIHANGQNVYIVARTLTGSLFTYYYTHSVRSTDGGQSWGNQTHIASFFALISGEYGLSVAGVGDRLYMGYEVGSNLYFRSFEDSAWSDFLLLESGDGSNINKWPTITQAPDGKAWLMWEVNGELFMREYDGSTWADKVPKGTAGYANLKLGTSGDRVEWISTQCNGAPFLLAYEDIQLGGGGNNPPQANDQSVSTNEDTALPITLTASDPENDLLTFSITADPANGTLVGNAPEVTYQPNSDYHGSDSFTFVADDGTSNSNPGTIFITVNPVNDAPTANHDSVTTMEDTPLAITLTGDDVDDDPLTYSVQAGPSSGSLSGIAPDLVYLPDADYVGSDSFTFVTDDGSLGSAPATVSIEITAANDPPVAFNQDLSTLEDADLLITLTATDQENGPLSYSIITPPANGTLNGSLPEVTYQPNENYNGQDSFTFLANDGSSDSNTATISITIDPVNDPPTANDDSISTDEDVPVGITITGFDVDSAISSYTVVTGPLNGSLSGDTPDLTYTPAADFNGSDSFTFITSDGSLDSDPATISIQVSPVNDKPTANDDSVSTAEDTPVGVILTGSDIDGVISSYTVVTPPLHGSLTGTAPDLTYTPTVDYNGSDSFTYTASDGSLESDPATISIQVTSVNDKPTANDDYVITAEDTPVGITLTGSDVDSVISSYTVVSGPTHGSLNGDTPDLTYSPAADFFGDDSFTFITSDGSLDSDPATISIQVSPVNDPPQANDQTISTNEDTILPITLTGSDPDNPALTYSILDPPVNGSLQGTPPNLTYQPAPDYYGPDSFTFVASDGSLGSPPGTITITVDPVNDPPTINPVNDTTQQDSTDTWIPDVADIDDLVLHCSIFAVPGTGATATVASDCSSGTYTPPAGIFGADSFSYQVCDESDACDDAVVNYTISASGIHVGDIDSFPSVAPRNRWNATVEITVHDSLENPVANALVEGSWSDGVTGGGSCITDASGDCDFTKSNIKSNLTSAIFTISSITHTDLNYIPGDNHDPDQDSDGTSIVVYKDAVPQNLPPQASFTDDCTVRTCVFNGSGSSDSDGSIVSYEWDFGDGNTASGVTTSHTFASDGTYPVVLTVTDDDGATDSAIQQITVGSGETQSMHVGDLNGYGELGRKGRWNALVTITIHGGEDILLEGAAVTGSWSTGREMSCTTTSTGKCSVVLANLKTTVLSVTFTVINVSTYGWEYNANENHETGITINRPPLQ